MTPNTKVNTGSCYDNKPLRAAMQDSVQLYELLSYENKIIQIFCQ